MPYTTFDNNSTGEVNIACGKLPPGPVEKLGEIGSEIQAKLKKVIGGL